MKLDIQAGIAKAQKQHDNKFGIGHNELCLVKRFDDRRSQPDFFNASNLGICLNSVSYPLVMDWATPLSTCMRGKTSTSNIPLRIQEVKLDR